MFESIEATEHTLAHAAYVADAGLATTVFLALKMQRPLFVEGEPGVGKTEVAKVLSRTLKAPLIRLQCYEGLDVSQAVYEWNYPRQLLEIQARSASPKTGASDLAATDLFSEDFLLKRPLLQAIAREHTQPPVLLIDELDRADEEFESFLLELLSDFQITIPELGTLSARHRPITVITSNRTREVHDALKRRCLYHWIDYPSAEKELQIVRMKVPALEESLAASVVRFVQQLREQELYKQPGVAETLDWSEALVHLDEKKLHPDLVRKTLGLLLKYQDDVDRVRGENTETLLAQSSAEDT